MASTTWPDGSPKSVDDIEYEVLGVAFAPDGIIGTPTDSTVVYGDSSGRQVKIRLGKYGYVHGRGWASGASDIIKTISANASGQPRIDLVVLGLDRTTWLVTEYVLTGTPAASPVAPALTRNAMGAGTGKWEIPLATVAVANGAATISAADVTPIHPWLGTGNLMSFGSVAAMTAWPGANGMRAEVDGAQYIYTSGAWRIADWSSSWGLVGGKVWTGSGTFSTGIGTTELAVTGFTTGAVSLVGGRRYVIEASCLAVRTLATGGIELRIRDTSVAGTARGYLHVDQNGGQGYQQIVLGRYDCAADETKTFVLTADTISSSTVDISRTNTPNTFFEVRDIGPVSKLTYTT